MSGATAGYSFILEFNETMANKVVRALFGGSGGVPTRFSHDEQSGLISSRGSVGGKWSYKQYLLEGMLGYLLNLSNPRVRFIPAGQQIELAVDFALVIFRQMLVRRTDDALEIPENPASVDPSRDYPVLYDSGLIPPDASKPITGTLAIRLNLALRDFAAGRRITIDATQSTMQLVDRIEISGVDWNAGFVNFLEVVGKKIITEILRNEIKEIDVTPLFGALDAFGIKLRPPIDFRLGPTRNSPALAVGLHEWSVIGNGDPTRIAFETSDDDYAFQASEGFFTRLISHLYTGNVIPKRYDLHGRPARDGKILLHEIRLSFLAGAAHVSTVIEFEGVADLFARADLSFRRGTDGALELRVQNIALHPRLQGLLGVFQTLFNVVTFYWLDSLVSQVLGDLLNGPVNTTIGGTLDEFLKRGGMAFSFNSPIRNTRLTAALTPTAFDFEPGRALIRGLIDITQAKQVSHE